MSLGLPARIKYISMKNQRHQRIFATRISDRQLVDVTPLQDKTSPKSVDRYRRGATLNIER